MTNPLVAEREDSTQSFSGVPILESVNETQKAIESGDWASGVMGAVGTGLDALGMALDPFGAILSAGVGWLMEHVGPLSDALDSLTGDPDQIEAHSKTWKNISTELGAVNTEMTALVESDTAGWIGAAGDAYRARSEDTTALIAAAQQAADGASSGIATAGEVVAGVRTLVRDIIAELVGSLISWALQVLATLGLAMAWVVPQVVAAVAKVAAQIADITTKLIKAMKALAPLLKKLGGSFGDAKKHLDEIKADGGKADGPAPQPVPGAAARRPPPRPEPTPREPRPPPIEEVPQAVPPAAGSMTTASPPSRRAAAGTEGTGGMAGTRTTSRRRATRVDPMAVRRARRSPSRSRFTTTSSGVSGPVTRSTATRSVATCARTTSVGRPGPMVIAATAWRTGTRTTAGSSSWDRARPRSTSATRIP
ncbi:WXG100 family type VII secretion target [Saccharopolyspora sp. CA-218241]|uniref:WXG100 family type VII secretion target n=1 Tax=Saccharopolyspora sp. CA-218241 TaxID=3240027 RepID=UPI003D97C3DF